MSVLTTLKDEMCYCPGCSHGLALEHLGEAIDRLGVQREKVCLVSDIGCVGTADRYFNCHTFHGLHGRSITYAEGIKRARPDLLVIVLIGDGGCGIGTAHLVHAARRGVGIKIVVFNNFNFGMTGGQHSPTTPERARTTTTPGGAVEHPFDICETVAVSGAGYVARCGVFDPNCVERLEAALRYSGFSLVDLWELCVAYYVPENKLTRPGLKELSARLHMPFGLVRERPPRPGAASADGEAERKRPSSPEAISLPWCGRREVCVAGSAGQRIRSAAGVIGEMAVAAGLHVVQQDDFPITVRKGHSISNLIVSSGPVHYTGVESPHLMVLLSQDGLSRLPILGVQTEGSLLVVDESLGSVPPAARTIRVDLRRIEKESGKQTAALACLVMGVIEAGWISAERILQAAQQALVGRYREENLRAIRVGVDWQQSLSERSPATPAASM